jgi:hypothetical protein
VKTLAAAHTACSGTQQHPQLGVLCGRWSSTASTASGTVKRSSVNTLAAAYHLECCAGDDLEGQALCELGMLVHAHHSPHALVELLPRDGKLQSCEVTRITRFLSQRGSWDGKGSFGDSAASS